MTRFALAILLVVLFTATVAASAGSANESNRRGSSSSVDNQDLPAPPRSPCRDPVCRPPSFHFLLAVSCVAFLVLICVCVL